MKTIALVLALTSVVSAAAAQTVKGNEAIQGSTVQTPPLPRSAAARCLATGWCHAGAWHMVETPGGLVECTEPYARPGTCRPSTYGAQKLARLWIVKTAGEWRWCQYPSLSSRCTPIFARPPANLPVDAVQ